MRRYPCSWTQWNGARGCADEGRLVTIVLRLKPGLGHGLLRGGPRAEGRAATLVALRGGVVEVAHMAASFSGKRRTVFPSSFPRKVFERRLVVFGRTADAPFERSTVRRRALAAWKAQHRPLTPIGLHECRHTAASLMIAAGADAKALSVVMGHASIEITFNRYGKLMPGGEAEVGKLLADYLDGAG